MITRGIDKQNGNETYLVEVEGAVGDAVVHLVHHLLPRLNTAQPLERPVVLEPGNQVINQSSNQAIHHLEPHSRSEDKPLGNRVTSRFHVQCATK